MEYLIYTQTSLTPVHMFLKLVNWDEGVKDAAAHLIEEAKRYCPTDDNIVMKEKPIDED